MEISKNLSFCYDLGNNCRSLSNLCHVVYATKGFTEAEDVNAIQKLGADKYIKKHYFRNISACR